jgi:hypothetical protein
MAAVTDDPFAHSGIAEKLEILLAHFGRKLSAVRLRISEELHVRSAGPGHLDQLRKQRSRLAGSARARLTSEQNSAACEKEKEGESRFHGAPK